MLCIVDIDTSDREKAAHKICALLELSVDDAQADIRKHGLPSLYDSKVRYISQTKEHCAFKLPSQLMREGGGDCKQLVLWRMAEQRAAGIHVTPRIIWLPEAKGLNAHAVLRYPDRVPRHCPFPPNHIEDPSINLGMKS